MVPALGLFRCGMSFVFYDSVSFKVDAEVDLDMLHLRRVASAICRRRGILTGNTCKCKTSSSTIKMSHSKCLSLRHVCGGDLLLMNKFTYITLTVKIPVGLSTEHWSHMGFVQLH